jgi:cell division protein FtsB
MKKTFFVICLLAVSQWLAATENIDSLLNVLDEIVLNHQQYSNKKEEELHKLKELLTITRSGQQQFIVCGQLFDEYFYYQKDSALVYAKKRLSLAKQLNNDNLLVLAEINLASTNGSIGMYKEAFDVLDSIDIAKYPQHKAYYNYECSVIYGYMSYYAVTAQDRDKFTQITKSYLDSMIAVRPIDPNMLLLAKTDKYILSNDYEKALLLLNEQYPKLKKMHIKAMLAYNFALAYRQKNDKKQELLWLTISSINDLRSVTKEYISLRSLAFELYESGDIDRAQKYMKCSLEDALFCNARLRTFEISNLMPFIDNAYQHVTKTRQRLLTIFVIVVSALLVFLLLAIGRVYRQMKKLTLARKELSLVNDKLSELNDMLLKNNNSLTEANIIKEEYIVKYMDQCSLYIDKMDEYRRNLHKTATTGKLEDLILKVKSKDFIEDVIHEFYQNFDRTFVQLFPGFVEELNLLLMPEERIHLKPGQLLNLELRIYALIRLGINDSVKIAAFLRCSTNTIYNYRTRNRNNALGDRDSFEDNVTQIGAISR